VAVGDRVMGLVGGGAMAEAVVVHHRELMAVPEGMALTDAAAIPEAFATAWDALVQAGARMGDVVLVHAAASGVGTAATQLARADGRAGDRHRAQRGEAGAVRGVGPRRGGGREGRALRRRGDGAHRGERA
jgi:NADPH:quinone reductase-like Zn-dependent oxidoreductase